MAKRFSHDVARFYYKMLFNFDCFGHTDWATSIKTYLLARLYESTGRAIAVTEASALASASALLKMLKFLVKIL